MIPIQDFIDFSQKNNLFTEKERILLAISGGRDSVLMAHFFKQCGLHFAIAHCNFQLRGKESERDEAFVRNLAQQLEVDFFIKKFDTSHISKEEKISTQLTARKLRYRWFEEICATHNFQKIATAHHQNDNVETLFFNLSRGCGLSGLHGILPKNNRIIRPLLYLNHAQINELVFSEQIDFVEDSSNASDKYRRNFIRHQIVPVFEKLNPEAIKHISRTTSLVCDYEQMVKDFITQNRSLWIKNISTDRYHLFPENIAKTAYATTLLFELLEDFGFLGSQCTDMLSLIHQSGAQFFSNTYQLTIDRKVWILERKQRDEPCSFLIEEAAQTINFFGQSIRFSFSDNIHISYQENIIHLDTAQMFFPLEIRSWEDGDKIRPLGMKGEKNISDIFIDLKVPVSEKHKAPILVNADGKIISIVGKTISEDFKISTNTKHMLILELES